MNHRPHHHSRGRRHLALLSLTTCALCAAVLGGAPGQLDAQDASAPGFVDGVRSLVDARLQSLSLPTMYIALDKPLYRPGETIWFRLFERDLKVDPEGLYAYPQNVTFQLIDPRGGIVSEKLVYAARGMAANDFELDASLAGGEYRLRAFTDRGWTTERPLIVSAYETPRIKKTLEFVRKAHGPGDLVSATVELERATGEALANHTFTALVVLDDQELYRLAFVTDAKGHATVRFELPQQISRGDGLLTVLVDDGGVTESIQRRIPIALERIDLAVYPEGGELIAGLESRVYFQARTLIGKAVDVDAKVVDDMGRTVTTASTFHNGMGRLTLTPEAGRSYELVVTRPTSITQRVALPTALSEGCTMRARDDFRSERESIEVDVQCTDDRDVVLTSVVRGTLTDATGRTVGKKGRTLEVSPGDGAQGAVRLTLFERDGRPLAERLVYRGHGKGIEVTVTPDKASYAPRDEVVLELEVKDASGRPLQGEFAVAVVDDTVLSYADDKTAQIMAATLLLPEMPGQVIEEPNFYFSDDPKAPEALDLLLGTQGWRRFAWSW